MALRPEMIEEIGHWCWQSDELAAEREKARSIFFGDDDPRPVKYWDGAEEQLGMEKRFYGWFMFDYRLPSGERPAEVAARHLYAGSLQAELLRAVEGVRYLLAMAVGYSRRGVYLKLDDEDFEVQSKNWATSLRQYQMVVAHLVPVRQGYWLPGPGWVIWPFSVGPHLRENLKSMQMDPIQMERLLQGRAGDGDESTRRERPHDRDLHTAVARMSDWGTGQGLPALAMDEEKWQQLVLKHMPDRDNSAYVNEVIRLVSGEESVRSRLKKVETDSESMEWIQTLLDLATNIWNNTPQPDKGGRSANEMVGL